MAELTPLQQKIAASRESERIRKLALDLPVKAAPVPAPPVVQVPDEYAGLGTEDIESSSRPRSQEDASIDEIIKRFTIEDALRLYCPGTKTSGGGGSEIMISCPNPDHNDRTPSASYDPKTQLWHCHKTGCVTGGDAIWIAALALKYRDKSYQHGINFVNLRKDIAGRMGWVALPKTIGRDHEQWIKIEEPDLTLDSPPVPPSSPALLDPKAMLEKTKSQPAKTVAPIATAASYTTPVNQVKPDTELDEIEGTIPDCAWEKVFPVGSFIDLYMKDAIGLQVPNAYNFWNAMIAISAALGRATVLPDRIPVFANLYVCTVGSSGSGKSKAHKPLLYLLDKVLPYEPSNPGNFGIKDIISPASGEALVQSFVRDIPDPANPKISTGYPVKGLLRFGEMDELYSKMQRVGGTMSAKIIEMYDNNSKGGSTSMGGGDVKLVDPYCMAISTIQMKMIPKLMTEKQGAAGFTNRWVFAMGTAVEQDLFNYSDSDPAPVEDSFRKLYAWSQTNSKVLAPKGTPGITELFRIWKLKYSEMKKSDSTDLLVRIDLLIKKLCLILAANVHETLLSVETVNRVEVLMDYIIECYKVVGAKVGLTDLGEMENRVLKCVKNFEANHKGELPTATHIRKALSSVRITMDDLRKILENLKQLELIEIIPGGYGQNGKPGRTGSRYRNVAS